MNIYDKCTGRSDCKNSTAQKKNYFNETSKSTVPRQWTRRTAFGPWYGIDSSCFQTSENVLVGVRCFGTVPENKSQVNQYNKNVITFQYLYATKIAIIYVKHMFRLTLC